MHILILNWRDIKNPASGGAEVLTHELAKRFVKKGHKVTLITSGFAGSKPKETVDGVVVIRLGRWWSVHVLAAFFYLFAKHEPFDVVIDEVHWLPFFSIFYAGRKVRALVCEVATPLFDSMFPPLLATAGKWIETLYFRLYRHTPAFTISPSTKHALVAKGWNEKLITVLPMGITVPKKLPQTKKETAPTVIYVGRIQKLKGIEDAIAAVGLAQKMIPTLQFWVVGTGEKVYEQHVKTLAESLRNVTFFGFVSQEKKFELMARAHTLLVPSVQEGWGLVVKEAAYVGTPSVGYDVPGLRDVITNEETGLLVKPGVSCLSNAILAISTDTSQISRMVEEIKCKAHSMSWDETVKTMERAINI